MSQQGKTQVTFIFTASPDQVAEVDRIFASHAEWMEKTHHREGPLKMLSYNVAKGPELSNPLDPSSAPTGNTNYVLAEVYENPEGLAEHWNTAGTWGDFDAFVEAAGSMKVAVLHGSPVVESLW
jgi:quinol monooxygenase YgiN